MTLQTVTAAGLGTSTALDLSASGQPCGARSLQQASEALREHLLPHLGLPTLMALGRASSDWHQLISTTPPAQLAGHANRDMLPHGLSSHQPLHEVLQERGSLLGRLRRNCKPSHKLSHDASHDNLTDTVPYQHSEFHVPEMCILSWSSQPDISQPSQHILISRPQTEPWHQGFEHNVSVLDLLTGRPVEFHAARSCVASAGAAMAAASPSQESMQHPSPGREGPSSHMAQLNAGNDQHEFKESQQQALNGQEHMPAPYINIRHAALAAWAADARHVVIALSKPQTSPHPRDPCSQTGSLILADILLRTRAMMLTQACERFAQGAISPAGDMLLLESSAPDPAVCLNVSQLPSLQHHFLLAPPAFSDRFFQTPIKFQQFAWSADGSKIAVWWVQDRAAATETATTSFESAPSINDYVTIHRADDGKCLTSTMILLDGHSRRMRSTPDSDSSDSMTEDESDDDDHNFPGIQWDSSNSFVLWVYKDMIACICPAQGQIWLSSFWERLGGSCQYVKTTVGSATSGQYVSVTDDLHNSYEFLTMLNASTGRVMSQWSISTGTKGMTWSAQSDVCLLPMCSIVLISAIATEMVGNNYWAFSHNGLSTSQSTCRPEDAEIKQHS